jgi:hypothetical protein
MISDNYRTETAEMLQQLGYEAAFFEDVKEGDDIAVMEKSFKNVDILDDREGEDIITFLNVAKIRRDAVVSGYDDFNTDGDYDDGDVKVAVEEQFTRHTVVRFIGRDPNGIAKPYSYGGSWGIYIKKR